MADDSHIKDVQTPRASRIGWSLHIKIGMVFAALSIAIGLTLTAWYQQQTARLLLTASDTLFERISDELTFGFQRAYKPVAQTVSLLSRAPLTDATTFDERMQSMPMLAEGLKQQDEVISLFIGYQTGDFFLLRLLRNNDIRAHFSAPATAYFAIENVDAKRPEIIERIFLTENLNVISRAVVNGAAYDPRLRPWYQSASQHSGVITTQPYMFFFLQRPGMTVARVANNGKAVVAADIKLESLSRTLSRYTISPNAETLLYEADGNAIAYRDAQRLRVVIDENTSRIATIDELNIPILAQLVDDDGINFPEGWYGKIIDLPLASDFKPRLAIAVPKDELLSEAYDTRAQGIVIAVILILLVIPVSLIIARRVSQPLRKLRDAVAAFGEGNFDVWLPTVTSQDEVGDLNYAFRNMRISLKEHIENLKQSTAENQRMQSELNIAHDIQMAMVPGAGAAQLELNTWQLDACLRPARSVGGDLYDVIKLDSHRYFILLGDVSDKGVAAALFMARTVTLAKLLAVQNTSLPEFLQTLNRELSHSNDNCMFVTLFCGIFDTRNGRMQYACAGHNPPIVVRHGIPQWLELDAGSPLGLFEDTEYTESDTALTEDDILVIYSDGITEAFDAQREEFSDDRLIRLLENNQRTAQQTVEYILNSVSEFVGDQPQSDDITLLVLGHQRHQFCISIANQISELERVFAWMDSVIAPWDPALAPDLKVIVDEVLANTIHYGYPDGKAGQLHIVAHIEQSALTLTFSDDGVRYNPLENDIPDLTESVTRRELGGLGVLLITQLTDEQRYRYEDGQNILTIKRFANNDASSV